MRSGASRGRAVKAISPLHRQRDARATPRQIMVTVLAVFLGAAVMSSRQTGAPAVTTLWAEDGTVFLSEALASAHGSVLLEPAVGYLHLFPRLVADIAALLPLATASWVFALGGALVAAAVAMVAFHASGAYLQHTWTRALVATSVVLVPVGGAETLNSTALAHFFLIYGAFWSLLWVPSSRLGRATATSVVALATMSNPLTAVLAPLAVGRLVVIRRLRDHLVTMVFAGGLAIQLVSMLVSPSERDLATTAPTARLLARFVWHVAIGGLVGERLQADAPMMLVIVLALWAGVLWLIMLIAAWRLRADHRVLLAAAAAVGAVLTYAAPVLLSGWHTPRYAVAPALLALLALVAIVDVLASDRGEWPVTAAVAAVLVTLTVAWVTSFPVHNERSDGPQWTPALDDAQRDCDERPVDALVQVPITPDGWNVELPCRLI